MNIKQVIEDLDKATAYIESAASTVASILASPVHREDPVMVGFCHDILSSAAGAKMNINFAKREIKKVT